MEGQARAGRKCFLDPGNRAAGRPPSNVATRRRDTRVNISPCGALFDNHASHVTHALQSLILQLNAILRLEVDK
jgi:hypothetical protein